jgi:phage gpG-like protein
MTLEQANRKLAILAATTEATLHLGETIMAQAVKRHVKAVYGDASKLQPDLAESTQAERSRLGFEPNQPLLRTGELLRDSIKIAYEPFGFRVGSEEPVAAYQEFGTATIPPRPAVAIGCSEAMPDVIAIAGSTVRAVMGDRRPLEALAFAEVAEDENL